MEQHTEEGILQVGGGCSADNNDTALLRVNESTARLSFDHTSRERPNTDENRSSVCHSLSVSPSNESDFVPVARRAERASSSSDDIISDTNMDRNLWAFLPSHLLDRVLACLPFWSIFRLRSVSKKWNSNLVSPDFMDRNGRASSKGEILFIMFANFKQAATYCPSLNKWYLIPLSLSGPCKPSNCFKILASAGGLVCFEEGDWPNRSLAVFNPMNRSYRKLPSMLPMKCSYVIGMMMDDEGGGYRVLVQDGVSLTSQYYQSKTNSWKLNASFSRNVAIVGFVSIEGFFFCLAREPTRLVAYNVKEASWHDVQVRIPSEIVCPHVVEHNKQLVVVGGVEEYGTLTGIRIWHLNLSSQECNEVDRMPHDLFHKLASSRQEQELAHFYFVGEAGLICCNAGTDSDILMYNLTEKKWWWLPACPLVNSLTRHSQFDLEPGGFSIDAQFCVKA